LPAETRPADAAAALAYAEEAARAAVASVRAEKLADAARKAEAERRARELSAQWAALPLEWRVDGCSLATCVPWAQRDADDYRGPLSDSGGSRYRVEDLRRYAPDAVAEAEAEIQRRLERLAAEKTARQAQADAEAAAYAAEREAWVRERGSERLRAALDLGLLAQSDAAYRDERLEAERPGWSWEPEDTEVGPARNPTLDQLRQLSEARRLYPAEPGTDEEVALEYLRIPSSELDSDDEQKGRALRSVYLGDVIYRWA
jgi:hypothetical protein